MLDESHQKYKFMEKNLMARRRKLKSQVPDINSSLAMLKKLKSKNGEGEACETQFLLSDQVYAKATIPPTEKVGGLKCSNVVDVSRGVPKIWLANNWICGVKNFKSMYR